MRPVSRELAAALAASHFEALPRDVRAAAERAVLDWLGSALAGAIQPQAQMLRRAANFGIAAEARLFGGGGRAAAPAALVNGAAAHTLELDDLHAGATLHAGAPVISAAFAVAEREHASGAAFLHAVVMGYEAALRIGESVNPSHYRFWHPTGTVATFGAAAAAATLLRLDGEATLAALGSAGTQAAGLWEFNADGAMSKPLHAGKAAFNGVLAADLARQGFTAATRILEGAQGFGAAFCEAADADKITAGLGSHWKILENGFKLHACCGHTHTAIDAALELRPRLNLDAITGIRVETYAAGHAVVGRSHPDTPAEARFCLPYAVAVALVHGRAGLDQFTPEALAESKVIAMLARVQTVVAEDLSSQYPAAWPCRLHVSLHDGRILTAARDLPEGHPDRPVSTASLQEKFTHLVSPVLGSAAAEAWLDALSRLSTAPDMANWMAG